MRGCRGGALRGPGAARLTRGGTADGRGLCRQGAAKALIFPVVQQFTEAFVQALQVPDGPTSDSGFKMEVLKVCAWDWGCPGAAAAPPASRATPGLVSASSGGDGPGEELPEAHGVLHAADPAHRLEHADRQRGFISFPGAAAGRLGGWAAGALGRGPQRLLLLVAGICASCLPRCRRFVKQTPSSISLLSVILT